MLESLVASILNRFLGSYVENFDPKQLNIGIWSGDVKLRDLRLKKETLDKFELPLDVHFGHLGELTLQIPWANLKAKPVKVFIENVYLLASPIAQDTYDAEAELKRELALKFERLADLEIRQRAKPTNAISEEDAAKNESFTESLVTKIVDNLQIEIKNIHLRYEDMNNVFTDHPYALGVTLGELSAISSDDSWMPTFISVSSNLTNKLLTLKSLCAYWNTDSESIFSEDQDELLSRFKQSLLLEDEDRLDDTQYILRPVSGTGHLTVNKLGSTETQPHIKAEVFFEEFCVDLDSHQYRDALFSASKFHWYKKTHKFKRFRPNVPVEGHGEEWFLYAARAVLSEIHERNYRWSWDFLKERRDNRKAYIKLWKKKLLLPDISQGFPDASSNEELRSLEEKLPYDDIKFFRSLARLELRKEKLEEAEVSGEKTLSEKIQQQEPTGGWLSSWWGGSNNKNSSDKDLVMSDEQRDELYQAIEFDETRALAEAVNIPRDRIKFELNAQLKKGGFSIKNRSTRKDLANIVWEGCAAQHYQRPDSFLSNFTLQEFKIEDGTETTLYKNLVSVKPFNSDVDAEVVSDPFFRASFENNPLDQSADSSLSVKLRSMTIFYHVQLINEIIKFFTPPKDHLHTINAIMEQAEATVHGLTAQTRMGLEAIWEDHKTMNTKLDLQAPLIILPLDPSSWSSPCAIIDAGHISVLSDLADKDKAKEIKDLSPEEFAKIDVEELKTLMYDRFDLHLQDTQILVGPTIKSTIEQLHSNKDTPSLILDKLDMKLVLELSIMPSASNLAKIRTTASLPNFTAKMNDYQYKIMMQLIDKCIPDFGGGEDVGGSDCGNESFAVPLSIGVLDDAASIDTEIPEVSSSSIQSGSRAPTLNLHENQHIFEFFFNVDRVQLSLSKCTDGKTMESDQIVDIIAEKFVLEFLKLTKDMHVDLTLGTFNIEDWIQNSGTEEFKKIISSTNFTSDELVNGHSDIFHLKYKKVQRLAQFKGKEIEVFDQDVDLHLSALKGVLTRKSFLTILNFILTTFTNPNPPETPADALRHNDTSVDETAPEQIRCNVTLEGITLVLNDDGIKLATAQLSTALFDILVLPESLKVYSKLNALTIHDEINEGAYRDSSFRKLLSFDGDELAEFTYETIDPLSNSDYSSSFSFKAGSMRVNFVEEPLNKIFDFLSKFMQMKALYDTARDAAFNNPVIQNPRMKFDVDIKTPIIVFPKLIDFNKNIYDDLTVYLGEFTASNEFISLPSDLMNNIKLGLHSTRLTSRFFGGVDFQDLKVIEDFDVNLDISMLENPSDKAQITVRGFVSEIKSDLTELQMSYLYTLSQTIPKVFVFDESKSLSEIEDAALDANNVIAPGTVYHAEKEDVMTPSSSSSPNHAKPTDTKIDFKFDMPKVSLTLHNNTRGLKTLSASALSSFSLENIGMAYCEKNDSHFVADLHIGALVAEDIRQVEHNKFTEIIPRLVKNEQQVSVKASTNGPADNKNTVVMVNVKSPRVILALDYLFALKQFVDAGLKLPPELRSSSYSDEERDAAELYDYDGDNDNDDVNTVDSVIANSSTDAVKRLGFSVNIVDTSLILLADPTQEDSEAIVFKIEQLLASQQNIISASANNVGMFLCRMNDYHGSRIRIIDDFSSSVTIDTRGSTDHNHLSNVQIAVEPLLMRVSLNDIKLALIIFNKAMELAEQAGFVEPSTNADEIDAYTTFTSEFKRRLSQYAPSIVTSLSGNRSRRASMVDTELILKAEHLTADIEGFRLVLIGSVNELPVLDTRVKPFQITAKNWSTDLEVNMNVESFVNIFNYSKSSWEALIEPWPFTLHISRDDGPKPKLSVELIGRKTVQATLSSRSIALLSQMFSSISGQGEIQPRGSLSSYRILNQTGYDLNVWIKSPEDRFGLKTVRDGEIVPWEFEDWRKVRENLDTDNKKGVIGVELIESGYDEIDRIPVFGEGEDIYMLTPPISGYHNRLLVDITLGEDNVKTVTLRSTIIVENSTQVSILVKGKKQYSIAPGESRALPIDEVYEEKFYLKPDIQVPFEWSQNYLYWKKLRTSPASIKCPSTDSTDDTCFYFQVEAKPTSEPLSNVYPLMKVVISAPLEIENLLPYDISYRLYDRSSKRDWRNTLKKGNSSPVHVVKLEYFLLLSVFPKDSGFAKSDFAIINSPNNSEFKRESHLCLKHEDGQVLQLGIHYNTSNQGSSGLKVTIFSPYVILNRTSKDIYIRDGYNVLHSQVSVGEDELKSTTPRMFSFDEDSVKSRALVKIGDSQWSKPVSLQNIGQHGQVDMSLGDKKTEMNIGMSVMEGQGKYQLTNVVTFSPRYIVRNNFSEEIEVLAIGSTQSVRLKPGSFEALYSLPRISRKLIQIRLLGGKSQWSSPFILNDIGIVYLKVFDNNQSVTLLKINIQLDAATLIINVSDSHNDWPFSVRNFSDHEILFYQGNPYVDENDEVVEDSGTPFKPLFYKVPAKSVMPYAWDFPAAYYKEIVLRVKGRERHIQLAEIGNLRPMKVPNSSSIIDLNVIADGPTQTLVVSNYEPSLSLYKLSSKGTMEGSTTSLETPEKFKVAEGDSDITTQLRLKFEGLGISLVNTRNQELCYITANGMEIRYNESDTYQTVSWKLKWLQVDNQLYGGVFPIIIYPTVVPHSVKEMNNHPAFSGSISKVRDDRHGVTYIKYATVLLQEMSVEIDEDFLFALLDFTKIPGASWAVNPPDKLCEEVIQLSQPVNESMESDLYFEALHIQPVQLDLSFVRTEHVNAESEAQPQNLIMFFVNILTMALGNINDAPIRLNALLIENVRVPVPILLQNIQTHYGENFMSQIYRVIGSADVIGNPVGLFNNISSGVMDIFYEPYQGLIINDRPQELGIGLAKGGLSFLKKSVFGFSDSFAKISGSLAKGLTSATMDKDYQERRRMNQRRNRPNHALFGIKSGAYSFYDGISSGISGVATAPMEGANKEGAAGFFKGLGKGLIGLPTKTAIGMFDMVNYVSEGIKNTTTAFDGEGLNKVRLPRFIAQNSIIEPFSEREAQGQYWLKTASGGKFINDDYVAHIVLPGEELVVIVTYKRLLMVSTATLEVRWDINFVKINPITQEKSGIKIGLVDNRQGPFIQSHRSTLASSYTRALVLLLESTTSTVKLCCDCLLSSYY
ncbi:Vacuolar protein sorting-associated protein 13 AltName: Full=Suppression of the onset of impotence protein 1; AltName: Full=Vacuolar protein-targeting protein 2 [Cyberlindnera jadinii]|uniref:Vacuolar protein sorting-associated protein n=1 Tax=Cyberlindnera jadinii (strain ATCC 18201 / CBS 1600 / BCRC 20928 / JCM 3617 / NBRC 0987 / NRRL Y-1542) TaxID=983966 RepID=A0A0H5C5L0_CYBJN|nr:Vacuolar protein sorting-associated protein 13 AltName: Full=Suppression of the onset of impotence protein 1; AltName: Full=Vacuolar protein-targeting protein 2 [Cyberlindnera jadinii]